MAPSLPRPSFEELRAARLGERLELLAHWLPEATAEEIAILAESWFGDMRDSGGAEWQALVLRWVEVDPEAALAVGRAGAERLLRSSISHSANTITPLHYVYRAWARVDTDRALDSLLREPPLIFRGLLQSVRRMVDEEKARAWALRHPEREELEFLRRNTGSAPLDLSDPAKAAAQADDKTSMRDVGQIADAWAAQDPAAALAWARELPEGRRRDTALAGVVKGLLKSDPAQARAVLDTLPHHIGRAQLEAEYTAKLAESDPGAALAYAREKLHGMARLEAITGVAAALSKTDPLGALKLLREHGVGDFDAAGLARVEITGPGRSMGGASRNPQLESVLKAAASHDPAGVMDLLAQTGSIRQPHQWEMEYASRHGRGSLARDILGAWMEQDTTAAARWLGNQPASEVLQPFLKDVAEKWHAQDAAGLQAYAATLPAGDTRETFVRQTAALMAATDPAGALEWAGQHGRPETMGATFQTLAAADPATALEFFGDLAPEQQGAQLQHLADQLGRRDPAAAVDFYASLPAGQQATVRLRDTAIAYAKADPQAASEWIATLPETPARDTAISGLVDYLIKDSSDPDPESAAHWAAASLDEEARQRRLQRVAEAWFRRAPAEARRQIETSGLPPAVKQSLLRHAPAR